jgi:Na+-driven multidrug efflux pump
VFLYSFGSAIIRVSGDSKRPLYYMIFAGALNVVMNFILCLVLENKVAAVGIATLSSQALGAVLVITHLLRIDGPCKLKVKEISFSFDEFKRIMATGLPSAFNNALYSISNLQIQSAINAFGSSAVAGNSASVQIEGLASSCTNAFGTTALTFVGQSIGAGKKDRVRARYSCAYSCRYASRCLFLSWRSYSVYHS